MLILGDILDTPSPFLITYEWLFVVFGLIITTVTCVSYLRRPAKTRLALLSLIAMIVLAFTALIVQIIIQVHPLASFKSAFITLPIYLLIMSLSHWVLPQSRTAKWQHRFYIGWLILALVFVGFGAIIVIFNL